MEFLGGKEIKRGGGAVRGAGKHERNSTGNEAMRQ
jgi:hypothetical protein